MLEFRVKQFLKKNQDIKKIDKLFTCRASPYQIKIPINISTDLCRLLGIIHGDGNLSSKRIHITDKCKEYHTKELKPLFEKLFGIKLNLYHDVNRNSYYSHIKSSILYRYFIDVLELPKGAVRQNLILPSFMQKLENKFIASYIGGVYDAESNISKRQAQISFSTTTKQIFDLVKNFLIINNIKYSIYIRSRRINKEYEIYIYGKENIRNFLRYIKISHPEKIKLLKRFLHFY